MAVVDLKFATVTLQDGSITASALTGFVSVGSTTSGSNTMTVGTGTGIIAAGRTFTVAGETGTPVHTVTSHVETTGNTTSIHFVPVMASTVSTGAALTIPSQTGPNELEIKIGSGNLSYTEKRNYDYRLDRGLLDTVREGDQAPVEVSLEFVWEFLRSTGSEPVTPEEAFKKVGAAANWKTSSSDPCEPYALNIIVLYHPPCGDTLDEKIVFNDFRWETLDHSYKDGQISVKGSCNVTDATVTREVAV